MMGALLVISVWALVLLAFTRPLHARWREPVFRHPALVVESDDWGAGPLAQTEALTRIASVLQGFRDSTGRSPVMTLGIVLEVPDTERLAREGLASYRGRGLGEACFEPIRRAIQSGVASGVFAPQLHGQCHYWPQALMTAAQGDAGVRAWLTGVSLSSTEALPAHLQSRWIDASQLPSRALDAAQIAAAVEEEAASYRKLFGASPEVAVPTTFVWNADVERAWKSAGVEVVITPGRRATRRDAAGQLTGVDRLMLTGESSDAGQCYLVRDVYCEPALGHSAQRLVDSLVERTHQGRACLVEMHRFNFLREMDQSLKTLQTALALCLERYPTVRFASSFELARAIRQANPDLLETRFARRLRAWLARLHEVPRFGRATRITGLVIALKLLERVL